MQDFKKLTVWQKSHKLALDAYATSANFPREEQLGLTSQLRRAAASIPANIAEGCGRGSNAELARFLRIAGGSANELEYHLLLARDLGHLSKEAYATLLASLIEVRRMLTSFEKRLRAHPQLDTGDWRLATDS